MRRPDRRVGGFAVVPALAVAVAALGLVLRTAHLGTPSLWWDELVHVRTADRPLAEVLQRVRHGVAIGSGNAGAMPADYVLLHLYLRATSPPRPERIETWLRTPSCVYGVVAVPALFVAARPLFGTGPALLASLLLATSLPAILYAGEARPYSLLVLATILALWTFERVAREPTRVAPWIAWVLAGGACVATGIFGAFVLAWQYLTLVVLALRRRVVRPSPWALVASAAAGAGALALLLHGTALDATYPRKVVVTPLAMTWDALLFLAAGRRALVVAFLAAVPFALVAAVRRGTGPAVAATVASFASLPLIALVISWKHYYFHGRHVLFLVPCLHLVLAGGWVEILRRIDPFRWTPTAPSTRRRAELALAALLIALVVGPDLRAFLVAPEPFFARTKTLRDARAVVQHVAARVRALPPGEPYLLLAERDSPANTVLSAYLEWYGLADRVALRSPGVPLDRIEPLLAEHDRDPRALALRPAVGLFVGFRDLLRVAPGIGDLPPRVGAYGIVGWTTPQRGSDVRRWFGVTFREPGATTPSPPRS